MAQGLTLELNIGREWCEERGAERPLLGDVVIGKGSRISESSQVKSRKN